MKCCGWSCSQGTVSVKAIVLVRVDEISVRRKYNLASMYLFVLERRDILSIVRTTLAAADFALSNPSQIKSITTAYKYKDSPGRQSMWQKRKGMVFSHERSTQLIRRFHVQKFPTNTKM